MGSIFENVQKRPTCKVGICSWRIPSKPSPNERSRFSFSKEIKIFWFSVIFHGFTALWTWTRSGFSDCFYFSGKSGSGLWSKCYMTCKNRRKLKIPKNLKNIVLKLPFGVGFKWIHKLVRFLQQFEICWFSGFWISHLVSLRILYRESEKFWKSENLVSRPEL